LWAVFLFRGKSRESTAVAFLVILAIFVFGAHASWANSEAGVRRELGWAWAVLSLPSFSELGSLSREMPHNGILVLVLGLLCAASWVPLYLLESRRIKKELEGEVALGFLPASDCRYPFCTLRRAREKSYGRKDERREFVRSALLLSVAPAAAEAQGRGKGPAASAGSHRFPDTHPALPGSSRVPVNSCDDTVT